MLAHAVIFKLKDLEEIIIHKNLLNGKFLNEFFISKRKILFFQPDDIKTNNEEEFNEKENDEKMEKELT